MNLKTSFQSWRKISDYQTPYWLTHRNGAEYMMSGSVKFSIESYYKFLSLMLTYPVLYQAFSSTSTISSLFVYFSFIVFLMSYILQNFST
ncbi:hypothetical protein FGO68_gene16174 [Halteria grandinella]|uniref:Uncharacterized protein n=1 Tax=Halteria grandinella TaxID=5974 RepID=A0A8J8P699_HALGN|nr:hypothetical protein FGO68_gene16174 [Halteria grandinella]